MGKKIFTTNEIASLCSVSKKTIRHYKKIDLISPTYIDGNGYWYFDEDDRQRLSLIQQLKCLELSLEEIKGYLGMNGKERLMLLLEKSEKIKKDIVHKQASLEIIDKIVHFQGREKLKDLDKVIEENHLEWLRDEFEESEIEIILAMFDQETGMDDHRRIGDLIKLMKVVKHENPNDEYRLLLEEIDSILTKYSDSSEGRKSILWAHLSMMSARHALLNELDQEQENRLKQIVVEYYSKS